MMVVMKFSVQAVTMKTYRSKKNELGTWSDVIFSSPNLLDRSSALIIGDISEPSSFNKKNWQQGILWLPVRKGRS